MKPYADTNFFTRLYLPLPESSRAEKLLHLAKNRQASRLPITWLHRIELANAFELFVWLGKKGGHPRINSQMAWVAHATFQEDLNARAFMSATALDLSSLQTEFEEAVARHTARHGFCTYDVLHVVSARLLGCDHFFSFDLRANKLAQLEGLVTTPE